jgi:transposase
LQVVVSGGNENERPYLLPLLDQLPEPLWEALKSGQGRAEVYADRGYDSLQLNEQITNRELQPRISRRRFKRREDGDQPKPRVPDPLGRKRWPIERTNAWLSYWRRLQTRWERRSDLYLAFVQLVVIVLLLQAGLG